MSTKQIFTQYVPVFRKTFSTLSVRTYNEVFKNNHTLAASFKINRRLLPLHESTSSRTFSNLSMQSANRECNRRLSYSCRYRAAHGSNFDLRNSNNSGDLEKQDEIKQTQATDPEMASLLKEIEEELKGESRKLNTETTVDENEQKQKVADSSQLDGKLNSVDVNKKGTEFEYDYQVAEDIEEYDYIDENSLMKQRLPSEKVLPISLKRGENGVFDLHELIMLLEHLGAENIVTVPVPYEANFCDHMVVVSAKSRRHLQAINDEMLWVHKRKKAKRDPILLIEGKDTSEWCAMDIGNIVLHIFYGEMREYYDIESLWLLGPDRDPKCQEQSADRYILSAEDMFWLETGQAKDKVTDPVDSCTVGSDTPVNLAKGKVTDADDSDTPVNLAAKGKVTDPDDSCTVGSDTPVNLAKSKVTDADDNCTVDSDTQVNLASAEVNVLEKSDWPGKV